MAYTYRHGDRPLQGFTIQRAVGRGGFGEVYYAVSDGGREVALKYLRENPNIELRGISYCNTSACLVWCTTNMPLAATNRAITAPRPRKA